MVQPDEEEGIGGNTPGEPAPPGVDEQSPAEAGRVDTPKKKSIESLALAITIGSMTVTASLTFGLYIELSDNGHSPRVFTGNVFCYVMYGSLAVYLLSSITASYINYHRFDPANPIWDFLHPVAIIITIAFFASYMNFEPADIHLWAPLASILGIVLSAGTRKVYDSANRKYLYMVRDFLFGGEASDPSEGMQLLDRGEPRVSSTQSD